MAKFTKLNIGNAVASSGGRVWKKLSSMLQLSAPTLSLDGDTLTITDDSKLATSFDILVDGEVKGTATSATFDLSTLELESGTYSISVVAKADGYIDSAESEAVSYEAVAADELAGTWVWNDTIGKSASYFSGMSRYLCFTCNGVSYIYWIFSNYTSYSSPHLFYSTSNSTSDGIKVYDRSSGWLNTAYKTIHIETKKSETIEGVLNYLKANATKIA